MKKFLFVFAVAISLTGCGAIDRQLAALTGDASKTCVDGVEYLQFTSGVSVAYTKDGKIKTCN